MINEEDFDSNRPDELREPKAIVEREGFQAVVASTMAVTAKGMFGMQVNADTALEGSAHRNLTLWLLLADEAPKTVFLSTLRVQVIVQALHQRGRLVACQL